METFAGMAIAFVRAWLRVLVATGRVLCNSFHVGPASVLLTILQPLMEGKWADGQDKKVNAMS